MVKMSIDEVLRKYESMSNRYTSHCDSCCMDCDNFDVCCILRDFVSVLKALKKDSD